MKSKLLVIITLLSCLLSTACTENSRARAFGGTQNIDLPQGQKLVNVTWKENSLWILTTKRPDSEKAKSYKFQEKNSFGALEGTVNINEK